MEILDTTLSEGELTDTKLHKTPDLGSKLTTSQMTEKIIQVLNGVRSLQTSGSQSLETLRSDS